MGAITLKFGMGALRKVYFDVVFIDLALPGGDGLGLLAQARARAPMSSPSALIAPSTRFTPLWRRGPTIIC
jgi:CheY-like chemotaxis protein